MSRNVLQLRNLSCERNNHILFSDLDYILQPGEILQVVGENGSGKTSLLRILAGLLNASQGEVLWCDQPIKMIRENYLSDLLYMGHQCSLKINLTPYENLQFFTALQFYSGSTDLQFALQQVGVADYMHAPVATLSAGQQRRVALARLLLSPAVLWLLDEPFTALDKQGRKIVEELIIAHRAKGGMVVLSTHQPLEFVTPLLLQLGPCP